MDGVKIYFEDSTEYMLDDTAKVFDIGVFQETSSTNSMIVQKKHATTPQKLLLNGLISEFGGKRIVKVEWYRDNVFLASLEGNVQTTYNVGTPEGYIEERIMFLLMPSL